MSPKRQTHRKAYTHLFHTLNHAHTQAQSHASSCYSCTCSYADTHHAFLYTKVYTCTYCGRQGHLAKFCYDKLNTTNSHVWIKKTNTLEPKKVWVPK